MLDLWLLSLPDMTERPRVVDGISISLARFLPSSVF